MLVGGDEMPGHKRMASSMKSDIDASCGNGDASDPSRGAAITPIIYNNIEEHKGNNIKNLSPRAAMGGRERIVFVKEEERKKNYLPYDFL